MLVEEIMPRRQYPDSEDRKGAPTFQLCSGRAAFCADSWVILPSVPGTSAKNCYLHLKIRKAIRYLLPSYRKTIAPACVFPIHDQVNSSVNAS